MLLLLLQTDNFLTFKQQIILLVTEDNIHIQIAAHVGLILNSTIVDTAYQSIIEGTMWYFATIGCTVILSLPFITVVLECPHSTLKGTVTCSSHRGTEI